MNENLKKVLLAGMALLLPLLLPQSAFASSVNAVLFASPSGAAGTTVDVFGSISNSDTTSAVFLNSDNFTLISPLLANDGPFFALPPSLAPSGQAGDSTGTVELFDIIIPAGTAPGLYTPNFFQFLGGTTSASQELLGTLQFDVTVTPAPPVPEPNTMVLLAAGLAAIVSRRLIFRRPC